VTRDDLAEAVYERHGGLSRRESRDLVDRLLERVKSALLDGDAVRISGFGRFEVVRRRARRGRNPSTGQPIDIAPRRRLIFRPSRRLIDALN
jgi:integration host factor subunit alpha